MSNLNARSKRSAPKTVTNHEGEVQVNYKAKEALATIVSTSFIQPKFYTDAKTGLKELSKAVEAVAKSDPSFVLKTASYARNVLNMRSVSVALLVEAAKHKKTKPLVRKFAPKVIRRADELTDAIAFHIDNYGKPIPNSLKRGVADSFNNFSKFQLSKYQKKRNKFTLADVIRLTWPKLPADLYKGLLNGTIEAPKTRETVISADDGRSKTEKLNDIIPEMGYMALLRNLVAAIEAEVSNKSFAHMLRVLSDKDRVLNSKQLPFRFLSAYDELQSMRSTEASKRIRINKALDIVAKAADIATSNLEIPGHTLYVVDYSGSMGSPVSGNSKRSCAEIACLLAVAGAKSSELADVWLFADDVRTPSISRAKNWLVEANNLRNNFRGGATYFFKVMDKLNKEGIKYDNIVVLSDMQVYRGTCWGWGRLNSQDTPAKAWKKYAKKFPESKMYVFDLVGYNKGQPFERDGNVFMLAGWSEKILDMIGKDENLVDKIEEYDPFEA